MEAFKSNILKLLKFLETYLISRTKVRLDTIDPCLIVERSDKIHLLKLCERILGAIVCSPNKEKYIDQILQLPEKYQVFLMETVMKYVQDFKSDSNHSSPQLTARRKEYLSIMEDNSKLEKEYMEISKKYEESLKNISELENENKKLQNENEEFRKIAENAEPLSARVRRESDIIQEIESFKQEISELKQKCRQLEREKSAELEKYKKEAVERQKLENKFWAAEGSSQQLRKKIEELNEETKINNKITEELNTKCQQIREQSLKIIDLDTKLKNLENDLLQNTDNSHKLQTENANLRESIKSLEIEYAKVCENEKFWMQKSKETSEELQKMQNELHSLKINYSTEKNTDNLLTESQEANYRNQIKILEETLENERKNINEKIKNSTLELSKKIEELCEELKNMKKVNEQENLKNSEILKENEKLKEEIMEIANTENDIEKECVRLKKDRDTLLEVSKRAQDYIQEYTSMKNDLSKISEENIIKNKTIVELSQKLEKLTITKNTDSEKITSANFNIKQIALLEERNNLLKDEVKKLNEKLIFFESNNLKVFFITEIFKRKMIKN